MLQAPGFLQYRHEQAYLLVKGNPDRPGKAHRRRAGVGIYRQQGAPDRKGRQHS